VDQGGRYILKPQVEAYLNLPENEDLSMRLASLVGIETPLHGLIYSKDGTYTYFIRRFDRKGQKQKIHVEDFAQLSDKDRDTKYDSTLEKVAKIIEDFCTFPKSDHLKLFERTLFSFLIGNEDHHLKNFSLIVRDDKVELSPAYDLVNSTLALGNAHEELALPIRGKKSKINREDLVDYFAIERLHLPNAACIATLKKFSSKLPEWEELIHRSFLPQQSKIQYLDLIRERAKRMGLDKFSQS
jgi:serine/threonine-protein kinase HipA